MEMIKKVLVPIDSIKHDNTLLAVEEAINFADGCKVEGGVELIFLHILPQSSKMSTDEKKIIEDLDRKEIEIEFEKIEEICKEKGLTNFRTLAAKGKPPEQIVKMAQREGVDMIVMGSGRLHDRSTKGRIQKFVYGSVTERVIHKAPCSVLVARP